MADHKPTIKLRIETFGKRDLVISSKQHHFHVKMYVFRLNTKINADLHVAGVIESLKRRDMVSFMNLLRLFKLITLPGSLAFLPRKSPRNSVL